MGGAEDGITWDSSSLTPAEKDLFIAARKQSPEKFGHIILSDEIPFTDPAYEADLLFGVEKRDV